MTLAGGGGEIMAFPSKNKAPTGSTVLVYKDLRPVPNLQVNRVHKVDLD